ncbi:MAG TPA: patatin-like phospholipase family protein [Actinopolymorphaceae bacterium]
MDTGWDGSRSLSADLILEGGGVRGLGLVGAVSVLTDAGYRFRRTAGTSAGAIVSAVLAALASSGESYDRLEDIARSIDLRRFRDHGRVGSAMAKVGLSPLAALFSALFRDGAYAGRFLRQWLESTLADLGVRTFGDLRLDDPGSDLPPEKQYALVVIVTDLSRQRMVCLPWDYADYGLDPDEQSVAEAVRASASIPFFFRPVTLHSRQPEGRNTLVDGGVLSNYPVTIFDRRDGSPPRWPTLGVRLGAEEPATVRKRKPVKGLLNLGVSTVETMMLAHDAYQLAQPENKARTIFVDCSDTSAIDFDIDRKRQETLLRTGRTCAEKFLQNWDFGRFVADYRKV